MSEQIAGVCERCGRGVSMGGAESRMVCEGCGQPTDNCSCSPTTEDANPRPGVG